MLSTGTYRLQSYWVEILVFFDAVEVVGELGGRRGDALNSCVV